MNQDAQKCEWCGEPEHKDDDAPKLEARVEKLEAQAWESERKWVLDTIENLKEPEAAEWNRALRAVEEAIECRSRALKQT